MILRGAVISESYLVLEASESEDAVFNDAGSDSSCEEPDTSAGDEDEADSYWERDDALARSHPVPVPLDCIFFSCFVPSSGIIYWGIISSMLDILRKVLGAELHPVPPPKTNRKKWEKK